jgi:hypothetical protein
MADNPDCTMCGGEGIPYYVLNPRMGLDGKCFCDTGAVLERIAARWSQIGPMGEVRTDQDYTDEGCRILARHAFAEVNYLIALLAFTALPKENS